ncbi:MAG: hypothetical protein ACW986_01215 [Promethearchaeota archaeon]
MAIDIGTILIGITLFVIFGIFLLFDLFRRNEKYGYLAYITALIPVNFIWGMGYDPLFSYLILFILWIITLLRDTIGMYMKKDKEINEILLYLALAILIQLIISAILPETTPSLKMFTEKFWFFWLPNVHSSVFIYPLIINGFKITATILVFIVIIPLILDIKDEEISTPILIFFVVIFIFPFLFLGYVWLPEQMWVLTFFFSVILFILLLLITRSGKETKK